MHRAPWHITQAHPEGSSQHSIDPTDSPTTIPLVRSYCTAKGCPQPNAPTDGTLMELLVEGSAVSSCPLRVCPSGTVARYSCPAGFAFESSPVVRGGYKEVLCVDGVWLSQAPSCVVSSNA